MTVLENIVESSALNSRQLAVLIDPDEYDIAKLDLIVDKCNQHSVDFIFYGGSLITSDGYEEKLGYLKAIAKMPVIIFPGSIAQVSNSADAILFLSLISGRNPDLLIGQQVLAAPSIMRSSLEVLSTGYMLIDCGKQTTASYISGTTPIPNDKPEIAAATAMAGELIGMKLMYLDGGSGAAVTVSPDIIQTVKQSTSLPLIVGGGIRTEEDARNSYAAGADIIVVGNQLESDPEFLTKLAVTKSAQFE